jgi:hypothetical protein
MTHGTSVDPSACRQVAPVSGLYDSTKLQLGGEVLVLRVDVDQRTATSRVTDAISGDLYATTMVEVGGGLTVPARVYRESWRAFDITTFWSGCSVTIKGMAQWRTPRPFTPVEVTIGWSSFTEPGPATVVMTPPDGPARRYSCERVGDHFRTMTLEVDVCASVNTPPLLPAYPVTAHPDHPSTLKPRRLTLEQAYDDAGVALTIRDAHTVIDDSDPRFDAWSAAELHQAMEDHFRFYNEPWPRWRAWGLVAGAYEPPEKPPPGTTFYGAMFDFTGTGGAGKGEHDRQGFAVFRDSFRRLPASDPTDATEAWYARRYLWTFVHELGHAFNLPHGAGWMAENPPDDFYRAFEFQFDQGDLRHIRHTFLHHVMMGADRYLSNSMDLSTVAPGPTGAAPLELTVRSKPYLDLMEPVQVELRLRNLLPDVPLAVDGRLDPTYGNVEIVVARPDGRIERFLPVVCLLADVPSTTLAAAAEDGRAERAGSAGGDRVSFEVPLTYGRAGFTFDEPGTYRIWAQHRTADGLTVASPPAVVRVGAPANRKADRFAAEFFRPSVGLCLALDGAAAPGLRDGADTLRELLERFPDSAAAARVATTLARSAARSFHRVEDATLRLAAEADPAAALALTDGVRDGYRKHADPWTNLAHHDLVRSRAGWLEAVGESGRARDELATLRADLAARGVRPAVLEGLAG